MFTICGITLAHFSLQNWFNFTTLEGFQAKSTCHVTVFQSDFRSDFDWFSYDRSFRSWSSKAAPDHRTTTAMSDCWYHVRTQSFQNVCLVRPLNIFPKLLGMIKIWQMWEELWVLFGQQWFSPWNSPMNIIFAQSLKAQWGLQFLRCCSGLLE